MSSSVAFQPANAREVTARVIANTSLSRRYFLLRLERPAGMPAPQAGHFVHVAVPQAGRFFLRRPFSVLDYSDNTIDLLIVEVGDGTRVLRKLREGDSLAMYGPLGNTFPTLPGKRVLAIGGGVGLAPLYFYGFRKLDGCGEHYRLLYGARTAEDLFLDHVDLQVEGVSLATDDGSHGFAGNVVQLAESELERQGADAIFSCGPTVMMRAAESLAKRLGVPHYVSLENRMACALGACRACVVPTHLGGPSPYRTVCHDGPVFNGADLDWDRLPTP